MKTKSIDFAEGLSLPPEVASSPIALLAQRGRGKTRSAKRLAEALFHANVPPVILDPAGVWWGLRLDADGKSRGLDIPVLGGLHGDHPLAPTGGKVLAEALVRTRRGCVIDVTAFASEAEKVRFASDFAETFYREKMKHRSPVHLFLEEADEWIPQEPGPNEARMLGSFQRIVRLGRNFGIGITMISQRPQGLSKKCLNLSEVVIALGLSGAHEKKALKLWMDDQDVSAELRTEVLGKLPHLGWNKFSKKDAGALIWAPQLDLFGVYKIKAPATLDSGATPEVGDDGERAALPRLNLDDLAQAMAATLEEAKANDPKELRAEVARLRVEISRKPSAAPAVAPKRVEVAIVAAKDLKRVEGAIARAEKLIEKTQAVAEDYRLQVDSVCVAVKGLRGILATAISPAPAPVLKQEARHAVAIGKARHVGAPVARPHVALPRAPAKPPAEGGPARGERRFLTALAQYPAGRTKRQVSILTGYSVNGGGMAKLMADLRAKGWIDGSPTLRITQSGLEALGEWEPLPTGPALLQHWYGQLAKGEAAFLRGVVARWPNEVSATEVAEEAGYSVDGGGVAAILAKLRGLELVTGEKSALKASDDFFQEGT